MGQFRLNKLLVSPENRPRRRPRVLARTVRPRPRLDVPRGGRRRQRGRGRPLAGQAQLRHARRDARRLHRRRLLRRRLPDDARPRRRRLSGGAVGLVILGACIGSLSALVQGVFQPASVKVMRGWQEGREYPLEKNDNLLGRDEHADIALFRDMKVEKRHAVINREGNVYVLVNNQAPAEWTRVNEEPVTGSAPCRTATASSWATSSSASRCGPPAERGVRRAGAARRHEGSISRLTPTARRRLLPRAPAPDPLTPGP